MIKSQTSSSDEDYQDCPPLEEVMEIKKSSNDVECTVQIMLEAIVKAGYENALPHLLRTLKAHQDDEVALKEKISRISSVTTAPKNILIDVFKEESIELINLIAVYTEIDMAERRIVAIDKSATAFQQQAEELIKLANEVEERMKELKKKEVEVVGRMDLTEMKSRYNIPKDSDVKVFRYEIIAADSSDKLKQELLRVIEDSKDQFEKHKKEIEERNVLGAGQSKNS